MTKDKDYDALSQKHLASIKRDMRVSLEDAAVRATHKVMAEFDREALAQPEQLPVAIQVGRVYWDDDKLMAVPIAPPQREWVGLTDGEIYEMYNEPRSDAEMVAFACEVEAKLKEKNT